MTQEYVATLAEISRSYYVQLETGSGCKSIRPQTAKRIARVLKFDWTLFFEEDLNATRAAKLVQHDGGSI